MQIGTLHTFITPYTPYPYIPYKREPPIPPSLPPQLPGPSHRAQPLHHTKPSHPTPATTHLTQPEQFQFQQSPTTRRPTDRQQIAPLRNNLRPFVKKKKSPSKYVTRNCLVLAPTHLRKGKQVLPRLRSQRWSDP